MAELSFNLRFLLGLELPDWSSLVPQYAGIVDEEQAALFRDALIEKGVRADALDAARSVAAAHRPVKIRLRTSGTTAEALTQRWLDSPEPAWLVDGYVPGVGLTLLASRPKRGKTLLAEYLAVQVAKGGDWLGFPVVQGPAVIIQVDQGWRSTAQRLYKWGVKDVPLTVLAQRGLNLESIDGLEEDLRDIRPRLIVMDAAAVLLKLASEFDNQSVALELAKVSGLADRLNCAILLVHHNRKAEVAEEALTSVRGGTAWVGAADCILELYANDQGALCLRSTPRDADPPEAVVLQLDKEALTWSRVGTVGQVKRDARDQRIYDAINDAGGTANTSDIARYLKEDRKTSEVSLYALLEKGLLLVEKGGASSRGGPRPAMWSLAPVAGYGNSDASVGNTPNSHNPGRESGGYGNELREPSHNPDASEGPEPW